jgi:hypothetical protein
LLSNIVKEGRVVVVDAGAWICYYMILAARNAEKVVVVEDESAIIKDLISKYDFPIDRCVLTSIC